MISVLVLDRWVPGVLTLLSKWWCLWMVHGSFYPSSPSHSLHRGNEKYRPLRNKEAMHTSGRHMVSVREDVQGAAAPSSLGAGRGAAVSPSRVPLCHPRGRTTEAALPPLSVLLAGGRLATTRDRRSSTRLLKIGALGPRGTRSARSIRPPACTLAGTRVRRNRLSFPSHQLGAPRSVDVPKAVHPRPRALHSRQRSRAPPGTRRQTLLPHPRPVRDAPRRAVRHHHVHGLKPREWS